ncbi:hypothetical protein F1880_000281 [Penicillium rolfsii]|nr:hypothetical protein F1880_000281 [Penicillium rolfsii]
MWKVSPNNRAGCQNKECKDERVKITKGEIRFGTWVETTNFQSWSWRHWGCTTPLVLSHLIKEAFDKDELTGDEDFGKVDGWDDLPEDSQETVRAALIQGHVDDDAWKGDAECNRPGMRGFRVAKKKAAAKKATTDDEAEETTPDVKKDGATSDKDEGAKPAGKVKKASRTKKVKADDKADEEADENGDQEEETPAKAKRASRAKKTVTDDAAEETTESATKANVKTKRASPRGKAAAKLAADAETQPDKRRGRPGKSAAATTTEPSTKPVAKGTKRKVADDNEQDETAQTPKRTRKKAPVAEETEEAAPEKPKRGRKKAAVAEKETEAQEAAPEKPKRGRKKATRN